MKRTLCAAVFSFFAAASVFSLEKPFFSGTTGFLTDINNREKIFGAQSYFAGQFDFSGKLFLRGEFYVQATDLFNKNIFDPGTSEKNASFRIEELSATYKVNGKKAIHYLTVFNGNYEPMGSDLFLQRQFGIAPIHSFLTESYHGIEGSSFYDFYSTGAAYTAHTSNNNVFGISLYKNKAKQDNDFNYNAANMDFRYATIIPNITVDLLAGISLPIEDKDEDADDNLMTVREIQMHGGINALFGRKNEIQCLFGFGIDKLLLKKGRSKDGSVKLEDLYFIIEPRIPVSEVTVSTSFFNIPSSSAKNMIYMKPILRKNPATESILGLNLNIVDESVIIGTTKFTFGAQGTLGIANLTFDSLKDNVHDAIKDCNTTFLITPYTNIEIYGGTLYGYVSADLTAITDSKYPSLYGGFGFRTNF